MGLAAVSLWRVDFFAGLRMGLGAHGLEHSRRASLPPRDRGLGAQWNFARYRAVASGRQARQNRAEPEPGNLSGRELPDCPLKRLARSRKVVGGETSAGGNAGP